MEAAHAEMFGCSVYDEELNTELWVNQDETRVESTPANVCQPLK